MNMKKICSAMLTVTMVAASLFGLTACNGSKGTKLAKNAITQIEENSEWFNYNETEININEYLGLSIASQVIRTGDGYALILSGTYKVDEQQFGIITDYGIRTEDVLTELNLDGSIKNYTTITPDLVGLNNKYSCSVDEICYYNGDTLCLVVGGFFDENTYSYSEQYVLYNFTQGKAENLSCITNVMEDNSSLDFASYSANGYLVATTCDRSGFTTLYVAKDGELLTTFKLDSMVPDYFYIEKLYDKGDIITVECITGSNEYVNFNIDTNTLIGKAEATGEMKPMYYTDLWKSDYYDEDGNLVSLKSDGIYRGSELICDFANSYCNPAFTKLGCIVDEGDDHYAILLERSDLADHKTRIYFLTFDKAQSNPNAGKTILTAGFTGEIELSIGTAISEFNQTNPDYFVMAKSYALSDEDKSSIELEINSNLSTEAIISNNLMMDMLAGDGPDILINTANYSQFNSDDYLMDLSSFIDEEFADGVLFDNVIEASKTNGKLYQLPTTFVISGIITDEKYSNGKTGFTFDEYKTYVDDACNGANPIAPDGGKIDAFNAIYQTMSELMYDKNGNVDMENDVFEQIASYCMDNIGQKPSGFVAPSSPLDGMNLKLNSFVTLDCIAMYLYAKPMKNDIAFMGVPSVDGRGPCITATSSIAISVSCCDEDGAKAFVKSLLISDKTFDQVLENPILVSGAKATSAKIINMYNKSYEEQLENGSEVELNSFGFYYYDPALVDSYIDILKSANCTTAADMNIMVIIDEEIQAYFAGQKSIDEVTSIIQSRAQTVVDER